MTTLSDRVDEYLLQERVVSNMLDTPIVLANVVAATVFYSGYAQIESFIGVEPVPQIDPDTEVSNSEWAIIRPLFLLYCERETAKQLEASRNLGVEVFGRASSEIEQDIKQTELDMPKLAFSQDVITV